MNIDESRGGVDPTRRRLMQAGLAGLGAAALGPIARAHGATARSAAAAGDPFLVIVNLRGGNDGLNTVVPVSLSRYYDRRPDLAFDAAAALSLDAGPHATSAYRFHPALDGLAALWAEGDVAVVHRVGYPDANRSHFQSEDIWSHGVRGAFGPLSIPTSGWIARWAEREALDPFGAVSIGMGRPVAFVGGVSESVALRRLSSFDFEIDYRYRQNHEHRLEIADKMLRANAHGGLAGKTRAALLQAHDVAAVCTQAVANYSSAVEYPNTSIAGNLRDIAIMLQAQFETRLIYTGMSGFDTHGGQGRDVGRQATLLGALDDGITAFADDLKAIGLWDRCVIAVISEFGRRNYQNGSGGTDHGAGNCVLLAGGAVRGGMLGPDLTNDDLEPDDLPYAVDFRSIYKALLRDHLGATDLTSVFPEPQEFDDLLSLVG